jgi:hypothetical protein
LSVTSKVDTKCPKKKGKKKKVKQQFPVASEVFCFSVKNAAITAGVS